MIPLLLLVLSCSDSDVVTPSQKKNLSEKPVAIASPGNVISSQNVSNFNITYPKRNLSHPFVIALTTKQKQTMQVLKNIIERHGLAGDNPWAISHALLALGKGATMSNGTPAIDTLFKFALIKNIDDIPYPYFPRSNNIDGQEILIEPHKNLIFKVLTEIQVNPNRRVSVMGADFPVSDLYKAAILSTYLNPYTNESSFASPNDMPWSVQALSTILKVDQNWKAENNQIMNINDLSRFIVAVLGQESASLKRAIQAGAAFNKDGSGIFKYTCGGSHLLQGAAYAMARGMGNNKTRQEILQQVDLLYYRFPIELQLYDELMKNRPEYKVKLLVQRMKFVGHFIESAQKLALLGYYIPNESQQRMLKGALDQLVLIVEALRREGILQSMYNIKVNDKQLYLDLIGDSAHAYYAVMLISGERKIFF